MSREVQFLPVQDFKELLVWQKAHALSLSVHRMSRRMRTHELIALRSQAFRAAMSIGANIAEGRRQSNDRQFARFLGYALNSASELEHHLIVARDLGAIESREFNALAGETIAVRKMLYAFIKRVAYQTGRTPAPAQSLRPASPKPPAGSS